MVGPLIARYGLSRLWSGAMPLLNFMGFRDAHAAAGVGPNDIAYFSQIQNWKFQTATPNNTTPYVNFYWNIANGPVVVDIPAS